MILHLCKKEKFTLLILLTLVL